MPSNIETSAGALVVPVILSGGSGTRLWPLSRTNYPKQFWALEGATSLFASTLQRVADRKMFAAPIVVCNNDHRFIAAHQAEGAGVKPAEIVLEPFGRNTAAAVAVASLLVSAIDPGALLLVLPSDHVVRRPEAFRRAVAVAAAAARRGRIVLFGIEPTRADIGYGYIRRGTELDGLAGCFAVEKFAEKPPLETAVGYLAAGNYLWNSGIFLLQARQLLSELTKFEPEISAGCRAAVAASARDLDFFRLPRDVYEAVPAKPLDTAVIERTDCAGVVPVDLGWHDVGSWSGLWSANLSGGSPNVLIGDVVTKDVGGSYIRSEHRLVAAIGITDLVVVVTDDAVLVASQSRAQDVKQLVEEMKLAGRPEVDLHTTVHRPWGTYRTVDEAGRFKVKHIVVNPGCRLSSQLHRHRSEHWVVVRGKARVTSNEKTFMLQENESTYLPAGTVHRLENMETEPLHLIEVQTGDYLGEDDIVRLSDDYGRAPVAPTDASKERPS